MRNAQDLMYNYICRPTTELPAYMWGLIKVPKNKIYHTGEICVLEALDETIAHGANYQVYVPKAFSNITDIPYIIVNGGFEETKDGRRPKGQPDYTRYSYRENEVVSVLGLLPEIKMEISPDCIANVDTFLNAMQGGDPVGTYLFPIKGNKLKWTQSFLDVSTKVYLYIEAMKWFRLGGKSGGEFAISMVVRVKHTSAEVKPTPGITNVEIAPFAATLNLPLDENRDIASITITGGTSPYDITIDGYEDDFEVDYESGQTAVVKTKQKYYNNEDINLKVTVEDSKGSIKTAERTLNVEPSPIEGMNISLAFGLLEGTEAVEPGAEIGDVGAIGRTEPFTYSFSEEGTDNDRFVLDGNIIRVGDTALEAKTYNIALKVTDRYNQTLSRTEEVIVYPAMS